MTDSNNRNTSPKPVSCATVPDGAKRTAAGSSAAKTVIASIWHTGGGKYAMIVIGLWVAVSAISLFWTPYRLLDTDGYHVWASPSGSHPLGTDGVGSDVLSWLMAGSRTNLAIALLTVCVAAAVGLLLVAAMVSRNSAFASTSVVRRGRADLPAHRTDRIDSHSAVRSFGRGHRHLLRIRIRHESGKDSAPSRHACGALAIR